MKVNVIARLTITRQNGMRTIIEVPADATFHAFYRIYTQEGARRSTKRLMRTANRNECLPVMNAHAHRPGLDLFVPRLEKTGAQTNPVTGSRIRIIRKRAYRNLIEAAPDAQSMVKARSYADPRLMPKPVQRYLVRIPSAHTPIAKRMAILTGGRS